MNQKQIMNWMCITTLKILFFPFILLWWGIKALFLAICAIGDGYEEEEELDFTLYYEDEEEA